MRPVARANYRFSALRLRRVLLPYSPGSLKPKLPFRELQWKNLLEAAIGHQMLWSREYTPMRKPHTFLSIHFHFVNLLSKHPRHPYRDNHILPLLLQMFLSKFCPALEGSQSKKASAIRRLIDRVPLLRNPSNPSHLLNPLFL